MLRHHDATFVSHLLAVISNTQSESSSCASPEPLLLAAAWQVCPPHLSYPVTDLKYCCWNPDCTVFLGFTQLFRSW